MKLLTCLLTVFAVVMQDVICRLEQTVSDFDQYSTARADCTALLALANEKVRGGCEASHLDVPTLHQRMEVLKACIYIHLHSSNNMIAKERKNETIELQRLQCTHSMELVHAMTVMYEGSITCNILRLEFLHTFSP